MVWFPKLVQLLQHSQLSSAPLLMEVLSLGQILTTQAPQTWRQPHLLFYRPPLLLTLLVLLLYPLLLFLTTRQLVLELVDLRLFIRQLCLLRPPLHCHLPLKQLARQPCLPWSTTLLQELPTRLLPSLLLIRLVLVPLSRLQLCTTLLQELPIQARLRPLLV